MISSMAKPHGRMAVVLPQGALSRKGAEGKIRQKILEMDLLEAVIGLQYFTNWIEKSFSFIPISKYFSVKCLKS